MAITALQARGALQLDVLRIIQAAKPRANYDETFATARDVLRLALPPASPASFSDTVAEPPPLDGDINALRATIAALGLPDDVVTDILHTLQSARGVQRLGEVDASPQSGAENSATAPAGPTWTPKGSTASKWTPEALAFMARNASPAPSAPAHAPAPERRVLDLRQVAGRNATERCMALVRRDQPGIDFDSCWMEACALLDNARRSGAEVLL